MPTITIVILAVEDSTSNGEILASFPHAVENLWISQLSKNRARRRKTTEVRGFE